MNYPQYFMPQQPMIQQHNTNGFISVRSENEAINYPVAPGNCVTFKIEGQPIVIEKSMGFSQFDSPKFDRYRLVKEDMPKPEEHQHDADSKSLESIMSEIDRMKSDINDLKSRIKEEIEDNEQHS
jgi:hypothetical protein